MSEFIPMRQRKDDDVAIRVENITKKFKVYLDKGVYLKERVLFHQRNRYEERNVLRGVSFEVRKGEAIGLVGENGCGKSTTLKLLSRIMYPDSGRIEINGRVSALIELGAGFHPDMSGRENIYTNAAIFGLNRAEIDRRLQTIINFSELGEYIDNPVRTYSSGMYMRLAFSVAINVDADILLVDEILAVGDVAFQAKCFNKLREIKRKGTTIVIVSHSLGQIEQICDRSYWIDGGLIRQEGTPVEVHQAYLHYMSQKTGTLSEHDKVTQTLTDSTADEQEAGDTEREQGSDNRVDDEKRWGSQDVVFESIALLDERGERTENIKTGRPFSILMCYRVNSPVEEAAFGIGIFRNDGLQCYGVNTHIDHVKVRPEKPQGRVVFEVQNNGLLEGEYLLDVAIHSPDGFAYDYYRECLKFRVSSVIRDVGVMRLDHTWNIE